MACPYISHSHIAHPQSYTHITPLVAHPKIAHPQIAHPLGYTHRSHTHNYTHRIKPTYCTPTDCMPTKLHTYCTHTLDTFCNNYIPMSGIEIQRVNKKRAMCAACHVIILLLAAFELLYDLSLVDGMLNVRMLWDVRCFVCHCVISHKNICLLQT